MDFFAVITFLGKALIIEGLIEVIRYAIQVISTAIWPGYRWLPVSNRYWYFLNGTETFFVMLLLYLGYTMATIIFTVFLITLVIKELLEPNLLNKKNEH